MPKVSVIISNRNDVAMLSVTVRSCIEEFRPLGHENCEIVICDNSDPGVFEYVKSAIPTGYIRQKLIKIIRQELPCLFAAREAAATAASGEYIICLDSHMLVGRNAIIDMVRFMDRRKDDPTVGFAHAPISWAHHHEGRARHDRNVSKNELGPWGKAYKRSRTITWKGMPWICRREWFLDRDKGLNGYGALAEHMVSWGGGDMHIGVKPWLLGFKNWAVPTNPCIHIGPFPKIDLRGKELTAVGKPGDLKYRLYANSGNFPHTFGFLVSCYVLGGEPMMRRNEAVLTERFGRYLNIKEYWQKAIEIGSGERKWLLERQKMSFEEFLKQKPWDSQIKTKTSTSSGIPSLKTIAILSPAVG